MNSDDPHVPELPAGYSLRAHERIASTNDEAEALALSGAPEGVVVWAREQTAGRGRLGRHWESPRGNLFVSLLLRPNVPARMASELSFVSGLGVREALACAAPRNAADLRLKWPNDVLVAGAKISGILLQSAAKSNSVDWVVAGIGVNLRTAPKLAAYPATSLADQGTEISPEAMLPLLVESFDRYYRLWQKEGFAPIREAWQKFAHVPAGPMHIAGPQGPVAGRYLGLDEDGALLLLGDAGILRVDAGDVLLPSGQGETISGADAF